MCVQNCICPRTLENSLPAELEPELKSSIERSIQQSTEAGWSTRTPIYVKTGLFNRITLLLMTGWAGLVGFAAHRAAGPAAPNLEVFLKSLLN